MGKTGISVSEVAFGGIPIQTVPRSQALASIRRALDLGINFIDTARGYTTSESIIGHAIKGRGSECVIATKTLARTAKDAQRDFKASLSFLEISSIDLYQIHNVNDDEMLTKVLKRGGVLDFLKRLRREGKVHFIGITSHRPSVLMKAANTGEFDTIMVPLNYVERTPLTELIPRVNKLGIGTIVMKPLGGGAFTNVEDSLRFVLKQPISTVAVGLRSIKEVERSAAVGNTPLVLGKNAEKRLENQAKILGKQFCRACDYCQPCPENIPISSITRADTYVKRMGWNNWYKNSPKALQKYANCRKCRQCEARCPYELPILELMEEKVHWVLKHRPEHTPK